MPRPTSATTVQRPDLGALAYEYLIDAAARGFIGMSVMPLFEVPEKSSDYPVIPIESLVTDQDTKRTVVKVVDQTTKEVVRQFPTKEALAIAKALDEQGSASTGLLIDQTA